MPTRKAKAAQAALDAPAPIMTQAQMDAASAGLVTPQNDVNNAGLWQNPLANDPAYMLAYGGALGPNPGDARYVPRGPTVGYQLAEIPSSIPRTATGGVPSLGQAPIAPGMMTQEQSYHTGVRSPEEVAKQNALNFGSHVLMPGTIVGSDYTSPISLPNPGQPGSNVAGVPGATTETATAQAAAPLPDFMNIEQDPIGSIYDAIKKANNQAQLPTTFQSSWGG